MTFQRVFSRVLSEDEIAQAVGRLAAEIRRDYEGKDPLLIGVLKGAFMFLADLVRDIDIPLTLDFIEARSYRGTSTTGRVRLLRGARTPIRGRHMVLVEDIIDTGVTADYIINHIRRMKPASLRLCALLDKPFGRRVPVQIDYLGFTVPDRFLVGYGLDLDEDYRQLREVYALGEADQV